MQKSDKSAAANFFSGIKRVISRWKIVTGIAQLGKNQQICGRRFLKQLCQTIQSRFQIA
jgi:hypothetical protein